MFARRATKLSKGPDRRQADCLGSSDLFESIRNPRRPEMPRNGVLTLAVGPFFSRIRVDDAGDSTGALVCYS